MAFLERLGWYEARGCCWPYHGGVLSVGAYRNGGRGLVIAQIQAAMRAIMPRLSAVSLRRFRGATLWNNWGDDISKDTFGLESARKLGARVAEEALESAKKAGNQ